MTNINNLIVGVPDSKLKDWLEGKEYIIAADEGEAVGMAAGHYLATQQPATVFMSADGLCNALNPLTSLIMPYQIPIKLVIGLRTDEPQHIVMGEKAEAILELLNYDKGTITVEFIR